MQNVSYLTFKLNHGFYTEVISLFVIFQYAKKEIDDVNMWYSFSHQIWKKV